MPSASEFASSVAWRMTSSPHHGPTSWSCAAAMSAPCWMRQPRSSAASSQGVTRGSVTTSPTRELESRVSTGCGTLGSPFMPTVVALITRSKPSSESRSKLSRGAFGTDATTRRMSSCRARFRTLSTSSATPCSAHAWAIAVAVPPPPIMATRAPAGSKPCDLAAARNANPSVRSPTSLPSTRFTTLTTPSADERGVSSSMCRVASRLCGTVTKLPRKLAVPRIASKYAPTASDSRSNATRTASWPCSAKCSLKMRGATTCTTGLPMIENSAVVPVGMTPRFTAPLPSPRRDPEVVITPLSRCRPTECEDRRRASRRRGTGDRSPDG